MHVSGAEVVGLSAVGMTKEHHLGLRGVWLDLPQPEPVHIVLFGLGGGLA